MARDREDGHPSAGRGRRLCLLAAALAGLGVFYGLCATVGEVCYFHARYGIGRDDVPRSLVLADVSARFYPFDYYVGIWAGKQAFHHRHGCSGAEAEARVAAARRWAERAYRQNPFNSEAVQLWADVLALTSPRAALDVWEPYVARRFWEPFNHIFLADLYMRAGELEKAEAALYWAQPSPSFAGMRARLDGAWRDRLRPDR